MDNLFKWYIFIAIYISILSAACLCVPGSATICLEESGTATGTGLHTMTLDIPGNLTTNESRDVMAYHGFNVTYAGLVGLNGTTWHVVRCRA